MNDTSYTLCNKGLSDTVASLLCRDQGYYGPAYATPLFGSEYDFGPSTSSYAIYNISCPYDYFSTYDCSYAIDESGSGCEYYYGRAIITCLSGGIYAWCIHIMYSVHAWPLYDYTMRSETCISTCMLYCNAHHHCELFDQFNKVLLQHNCTIHVHVLQNQMMYNINTCTCTCILRPLYI